MITKSIKTRIKEYFFENPTARLRVRHIEKRAKVPLPSAIRYSKELAVEGILQKVRLANVTLFMADRTSKKFLIEKRLYNIKKLYDCGLVDFLVMEHANPTIIVFGSYARGEDTEASDIDLYIETSSKINLEKFEKELNRRIQLFCHKNIREIANKELANNIINGFVLNGYIEALK